MTSAARIPWRQAGISLLFGCWAAAIAMAPSLASRAALAAPAVVLPGIWWSLQNPSRWVRLFLFAAILLPPLPIALGDSGPHLALAAAALGLLAAVVWLPQWRVETGGITGAMAAMPFVLAASLAPAAFYSGLVPALASAARVGLFAIAPFVFFYIAYGPGEIREPLREVRRLYWFAIVGALFACVDFYFQFPAPAGFGAQYVWLDSGVYRRAQGLFYEASTLGNFCTFFLVMIAAALAQPARPAPLRRLAILAGAPILLGALVLSYSRGSVVALAVSLIALGWLHRRRIRATRVAAVALIGVPLSAWLIWAIFPNFLEIYWSRLSGSAQFFFSSTEGVLSGRVASWRTLAGWIETHPWQLIFGIGYKTLPYTDYLGVPVVADNMYLSLLVETGIAGLAAVLWLNQAILSAALRASRSADSVRAFLGAWIFCFWAGESVQMLSGDLLTYWRVLPVYFFVLALAVRR